MDKSGAKSDEALAVEAKRGSEEAFRELVERFHRPVYALIVRIVRQSELAEDLAEHSEAGISLPVAALAANPPALRQRLIRLAVASEFAVSLSRAHTLEVARLVTDWHGQGPIHLPGIRVERQGGLLTFRAALRQRKPRQPKE